MIRTRISQQTGGLTYAEMITLAEQANLRHALWTMGEAITTLFEQVIERTPALQTLPASTRPSWSEITTRWGAGRLGLRLSEPGRLRRYRSISPITMSSEPTTAGMSASRKPSQSGAVGERLQKQELLARARSGSAASLPTK
jgi:hypothetical protein